MKLLLVFILSTTFVYGQNAVPLEKDQTAPFKGILIKKERVDKLVKSEKKLMVIEDLTMTQKEIIQYHKQTATHYRKKLAREKFNSWTSNVGYFLLGTLLTTAAFGIVKEAKK